MAILTPPSPAAALLAALLGVGSAHAASNPDFPVVLPASLGYTVLMDKDPIGRESYDFRQDGGHTTVTVQTKTDVKLLFLTFHYRHQRQEDWQDGKLIHLSADTDDDGTKHHVEEESQGTAPALTLDGKPVAAAEDSLPLSLWSKAILATANLYGVTDAQPYHVSVQDLGKESLTLHGQPQDAWHYRISGDIQRDLWYGQDGLLLQAAFERRGYPIKFIRE